MKRGKVILLDVDEVLADFLGSVIKASKANIDKNSIKSWHFFENLSPELEFKMYKILSQKSFWENLDLMPGAQNMVKVFQKDFDKILFVTAPWADDENGWKCDAWGDARFQWLKKHFGASYKDIIIGYEKQFIDGDVLIDDKFDTIKKWQLAHPDGKAWLMNAPYNVEENWKYRVCHGKEYWNFLKKD